MKMFCQCLILLQLVLVFLSALYSDFHGREQKEPYGYPGAVMTVIFTAIIFAMYKAAGAFSELF